MGKVAYRAAPPEVAGSRAGGALSAGDGVGTRADDLQTREIGYGALEATRVRK